MDQVCDGVNTDTKLYFEAIFDAYSIRPNCLLITTGQDADSEGTLEVSVDSGYGYVKVTPSEVTFFSPDEIVVDKCFASIVGVQVSNPTTNGWAGYIEVSSDKKKTYSSMICKSNCDCDTCTSNCDCDASCGTTCSDGSKTMVVVDGNNDNNYGSVAIKCLDGKKCTFEQHDPSGDLELRYCSSGFDTSTRPYITTCNDGGSPSLKWQSNTKGVSNYVRFQEDGNLVVYDWSNSSLWDSATCENCRDSSQTKGGTGNNPVLYLPGATSQCPCKDYMCIVSDSDSSGGDPKYAYAVEDGKMFEVSTSLAPVCSPSSPEPTAETSAGFTPEMRINAGIVNAVLSPDSLYQLVLTGTDRKFSVLTFFT